MMLTIENIAIVHFVIPIYQLLYFTIQLISFKRNNLARKYLGLLLLTITLFLIINTLHFTNNHVLFSWAYSFFTPLLLVIAPMFYLYLASLINGKNLVSLHSKLSLFVLPLLVLLINLITFGFTPADQRVSILSVNHTIINHTMGNSYSLLLLFWLAAGFSPLVQVVIIAMKTIRLLKYEKQAKAEQPTQLAYLQFRWLISISVGLGIFMVSAAIQFMVVSNHTFASTIVFNLLFLFSGGTAGYFAMKQDELFNNVSLMGSIKASDGAADYIQPVLNPLANRKLVHEDEAVEIIRKIKLHILNEKPYLDKRFTINDLSRQTNVSRNKLTFVINEVMDKNFYSLVNDYRVREAMDIMKTHRKLITMDAVSDQAGFQARSTFYVSFKKYTGQTPTEYLATLIQGKHSV
jgi:AraC-like DNA-binding protein